MNIVIMALIRQLKQMPRNWFSRQIHAAPRAANILPSKVLNFIEDNAERCGPKDIHICDGSEQEYSHIMNQLASEGMARKLPKYDNCWLVNTDPRDVARVESRTFICTKNKDDVVPHGENPAKGVLPNWMSLDDLDNVVNDRFRNCMNGRTMYVVPFSMGPVGSKYSKIGIQLTDSPYVVASMRTMTRMGESVLDYVGSNDFVKCLHSVGEPIVPGKPSSKWPCNPDQTIIAHKPESDEIISFGSGYGGNSLLGKKCLALRIGSWMAREQGWLAEHMLILGITSPHSSKKRYIAAAFPSACGKTNLAMMTPKLPGYKVECVGDDIAWLHFDKNGQLRAINPENGFFGVAPGTNAGTNPVAMDTIFKDTVFTNVASTSDGGVWWEGMEPTSAQITDWKGEPWDPKSVTPAAHPNSRFTSPATNCPILDNAWEHPEGVPIDAILFGGRRPKGIPLVYEAFNWAHSVFIGTTMRSEATAAAEFKSKQVMNDPFAMRPFVGYNIGQYIEHWLHFAKKPELKLPKVFHVNWFRKDEQNKFMWPGFGDNIRVLDWVLQRVENSDSDKNTVKTEIGYVPTKDSFNLNGLDSINWDELFRIDRPFWAEETASLRKYLNDNIGSDLPKEIKEQLDQLESRVRED